MAKKNETPEAAVAAPEPDASPAVLQRVERVRFIGGDKTPALSVFNRQPLPPIEADDTFEFERARAKSLVRYWPDRYQIVKGE